MKKFGNLESGSFGCNMLCQAAGEGSTSGSGTHKAHQKWSSELKAWVWCIFCGDPEYYTPPADNGNDPNNGSASGYDVYDVYDGYGCDCKCNGCQPVIVKIVTSADSVEGFTFNNDKKGALKKTVTEVGKTKWGSRALYTLDHYDKEYVNIEFAVDPNYDQYGFTQRTGMVIDPNINEPTQGNMTVGVGYTGVDDYVTTAHELFHALDLSTSQNNFGGAEMGARMFESILREYDDEARGSSSIDPDVEGPAKELLDDLIAHGWDKNAVSQDKWNNLRDALYSITEKYVDGFGNTQTRRAYEDVKDATLDKFDVSTLRDAYEDYSSSVRGEGYDYGYDDGYSDGINDGYNGNDDSYGDGNRYSDGYGIGYNDGYEAGYNAGHNAGGSGNLDPDCDCDCPDCECKNIQ